jgi:conjugative relaxase-like TrwC/TraI family protein
MVVSIVNISPAHGSRYYTQEGNYADLEQHQHSSWNGKLVQVLGLAGVVEPQPLTHLLHGRSPTGEQLINKSQLHRQQENAREQGKTVPMERAGIDLTSSAPKSVSIQALVFGDRCLEEAHRYANDRMLQFLEENYACTRIRQNGQRTRIQTGQLAIAQFHHDTSRALDPQLHTHNLILNLQQRPDGKWQSLDNESIYQARTQLGKRYRQELAKAVQALGYEIEVTNSKHEFWELKGYSQQQLEQFSKRTQQIQAAAGEDASSREKAWITMTSGRQQKQSLPRSSLISRWQQEAIVVGMTPVNSTQVFALPSIEQNPGGNRSLQTDNPQIRGLNDFQRDENQISTTPTDRTTYQYNSQPAEANSTEILFDRTSIEQFRSKLRTIVNTCQSNAADGCLGGLEPTHSSHCRAGGATDPVAQTHASMPDHAQTDVGDSATTDRGDVYSLDHGGAGVGYPDNATASEAEPETEDWGWERDYRQSD